ncbi:MAG: LysR family transcriptional regulator [Gemmataceae bacterium]|nr:LysR family transcriptional regulator [Gemmataceae bacterium]
MPNSAPETPAMGREDRYKDIQLPQLRSFCVAATEGNFTAAAKALGLSPPTVWQQVRALERRLRTTLLRRRGRNVELTPEGRMLLELVQPHVSGLDSLEPLFLARQALLPKQLTVAAIPYLTSSHLLGPVREFRERFPDIRLKLQVCVWFDDVSRMVEQGQADLGVIFHDRDGPRSPHLDYEPLMDLQFALLTPADHPLARKKRVTAHDLVQYPLIVPPEGSYARRSLDQLLQRHDLADQAHVVMETPLLDIIRKYVAGGIGIALMHIAKEAEPTPNVHVRVFETWRDAISVVIVSRKGAHHSEQTREFQRIVRQCLSGQRNTL